MEFKDFKTIVADAAKRAGIEDYELYYVSKEESEVSLFNGEPTDFTASLTGGVAFRCIVGGHMGSAGTQDLSPEQAGSLVRRAMDNALTLEKEEEAFFAEGGAVYPECKPAAMPVLTPEQLTKAAFDANEALKVSHEKITDRCSTQAVTLQTQTSLMNSRGVDLSWTNSVDAVVLGAVVSDGTEDNDDYDIKAGDPASLDLKEIARETAARAAAKLGAGVAPTGAVPVIFAPDAMYNLLLTFAPGTEAGMTRGYAAAVIRRIAASTPAVTRTRF